MILIALRTGLGILIALTVSACAAPVANAAPLSTGSADVEAAAIALDDAWRAAAVRGDTDAVLACFREADTFSFVYQGGRCASLVEFGRLVRRSYEDRAGFSSTLVSRWAQAVTDRVAVVSGVSRVHLTMLDGEELQLQASYGFVCSSEPSDGWRIVHAYEFAADASAAPGVIARTEQAR